MIGRDFVIQSKNTTEMGNPLTFFLLNIVYYLVGGEGGFVLAQGVTTVQKSELLDKF